LWVGLVWRDADSVRDSCPEPVCPQPIVCNQCGTNKAISNACRWKLTILVVLALLGQTLHQKRRKKVKRDEGESGAGCWRLGLQLLRISTLMCKEVEKRTRTTWYESYGEEISERIMRRLE